MFLCNCTEMHFYKYSNYAFQTIGLQVQVTLKVLTVDMKGRKNSLVLLCIIFVMHFFIIALLITML